ncbi:flagellar hook-length control protein FliK [Vreelandella utahensis]|uniref:flagellar hook-length control protein FliK n=1 Tax=Vreelandella halophila TaxID=86177 RepID=UPI0015C38B44|nr:flagellar hook-length control protein FliK [Halomonas utahensis]
MKVPVLSLLTRTASSQPTGADPARLATQLERAGLREGEPRLARLLSADGGSRPAGDGSRAAPNTRLLLEVGGQRLPVRSDQALDTGTMVKVMRAGNELRLIESLQQPSRSTLSQSLANRIPFQHDLGQGLSRLAAQTNDPALPQQIRQGLAQLTRLMPPAPPSAQGTGAQATPSPAMPGVGMATGSATAATSSGTGQNALPALDSMSGAQVREWISQSGLFREASMLRQPPAGGAENTAQPRADLKSQLIQLAAQLLPRVTGTSSDQSGDSLHRLIGQLGPMATSSMDDTGALRFPTSPASTSSTSTGTGASNSSMGAGEMLRLLAGMINRLTVNQLHSQAASAGTDANAPNQTWILELPWVSGNQEVRILQGRLEEYGPRDTDPDDDGGNRSLEREWRLTLALSFDTTGPLYFEVNLRGRQLRTQVWAEKPATVELIESTRERLETALSKLDLDVSPVECMEGQPPARITRLTQQLVDEHA